MDLWGDAQLDPSQLPNQISNLSPVIAPWDDSAAKKAAVAVLFMPPADGDTAAQLILTRRSTTVGSHKGQIAFAGGRADSDDGDPSVTARREAMEELGTPFDSMTVHGVLPEIRSIDGSRVVPVVITSTESPASFQLSTAEVSYAIVAPWTRYQRAEAKSFGFRLFGMRRETHLYRIDNERVWGLTARILFAADLL